MQPGGPPPPFAPPGAPQVPPPPPPYAHAQQAPPPYYVPPYPNAPIGAATDAKATVALVLGIVSIVSSMCYVGFLFGIPAFILGVASRRAIARSEGALGGGGMALAGAITGGIGGAISLLQITVVVAMIALAATAHAPPSSPPPAYAPTTSTGPSAPPVAAPSGVNVVDLHASGGTLASQLAAEYARAAAAHEKLLVMTTAKWSKEAAEISAAFADDEMEEALQEVTVVRVDVDEFKAELRAAKLERPGVPWFFLIGPTFAPTDAISADEWGANDPHAIAGVLGKFVTGTLTRRRAAPKGTAL